MAKKSGTEILEAVASAVNLEAHPFPTPWDGNFKTMELSKGHRIIVEVSPDLTIEEVPAVHLVNKVVAWMRLHNNPDWFLTAKRASEAVEMWRAFSSPILDAEIKPVRWASERGYAWHRLPWDAQQGGATPTWDTLLARMSNREAFMAFVGSLLFGDSKQHQYVWMQGVGGDGKGAINRWLHKVLGRSYRSKQPPGMNDRFWTYGLIGSRLVVFPDCNAKSFTASGLFKSLTGGDPVDVEAKNQMSFTTQLDCKFMFLSNESPTISSEWADLRRIIYCQFEDDRADDEKTVDPAFEPGLWAEGGAFLTKCVMTYAELAPNHIPISTDKAGIESWIGSLEEEFETVFNKHFEVPKNPLYRKATGINGLDPHQIDLVTVEGGHLLQTVRDEFPGDRKQQAAFRDWLEKRHGVSRKTIYLKDTSQYGKRWVGICRKLNTGGFTVLAGLKSQRMFPDSHIKTVKTLNTREDKDM